MINNQLTIAEVSALLSETGQFSLVEWFLSRNLLPYSAYEQWRSGDLNSLDESLTLRDKELEAAIEAAQLVCSQLHLIAEPIEYYAWQGSHKALVLSRVGATHRALSLVWRRAENMPQLDLFMDNSAVVSENQLQQELAARQYQKAQITLGKVTALNTKNAKLGAYQDLINYGVHTQTEVITSVEQYALELSGLLDEVSPLAKETLKSQSRDYLAAAWLRLAQSAITIQQLATFEPSQWRCHPAFAFSQIPDWNAVRDVLKASAVLHQSPDLMCLMANALFYGEQPQAGFLLWGQIAERYPEFAEANIGIHELVKNNIALTELWDSFLVFDDHWPSQWFLGFLLIQRPGLMHLIDALPKDGAVINNAANQIVLDLVKAKIQEQDQNLLRAQLKSTAPALLRCFMHKRDWYSRNV